MIPVETRTGQGAKKPLFLGRRADRVGFAGHGACRRRRADLPDRLHGVGEDDGRAPAGRAPGVGVRRPGQGHRGRGREDGRRRSSRRRGRPGSGSARPRRCARWRSAGRRWSRPEAARLAATRTSRRCWRRGACSGWGCRPRKPSSARGRPPGARCWTARPIRSRRRAACSTSRQPFYARAHARIDTDGRGAEEIVNGILRASLMMGVAGGMLKP